jgi:TPR repeat protein
MKYILLLIALLFSSLSTADDFYTLLRQANQGYVDAQNNLGSMYERGQGGVASNYKEAVRFYRLAANQGDAKAQTNLGSMYYYGEGVTKDHTEAVRLYHLAADQGLADAQYNLGFMYERGQGVAQDYAEAIGFYRLAAKQGDTKAYNALKSILKNKYHKASKKKNTSPNMDPLNIRD